jgi:hypothetical protein
VPYLIYVYPVQLLRFPACLALACHSLVRPLTFCAVTLTVKTLVLRGAEVNALNLKKETPLHSACALGLASCVTILMSAGARRDVPRWDGKTPEQLAYLSDRGWSVRVVLANWDAVAYEKKMWGVTQELALRASHKGGVPEAERMALLMEAHLAKHDPTHKGGGGGVGGGQDGAAAGGPALTALGSMRPDPGLEAKLPAQDLIQRWRLFDSWAEHRKRHPPEGSGAEAMREAVAPTLQVADYNPATGKLQRVAAPAPGSRADFSSTGLVDAARATALGDGRAGRHVAWLRFGREGHDMLSRTAVRAPEVEETASVDGIADGPDLDGSMATRQRGGGGGRSRGAAKKGAAGRLGNGPAWALEPDEGPPDTVVHAEGDGADVRRTGSALGTAVRNGAYRPSTSHGLALAATLRSADPAFPALAEGGGAGALSLLQSSAEDGTRALQTYEGSGSPRGHGAGSASHGVGSDSLVLRRPPEYAAEDGRAGVPAGSAVPAGPEAATQLLGIAATHSPYALSLFTGARLTALRPHAGAAGGGGGGARRPGGNDSEGDSDGDSTRGTGAHGLLGAGDGAIEYLARGRAGMRKVARRRYRDAVADALDDADPGLAAHEGVREYARDLEGAAVRRPTRRDREEARGRARSGAGGNRVAEGRSDASFSAAGGSGSRFSDGPRAGGGSGYERFSERWDAGSPQLAFSPVDASEAGTTYKATASVMSAHSRDGPLITDAAARRVAIAAQLMEDAPGADYARKYTHVVDKHVVSRRPAVMSGLLRASRYRLDGRAYAEQAGDDGQAVMSMASLQKLVVGTTASAQRAGTRVTPFAESTLPPPAR